MRGIKHAICIHLVANNYPFVTVSPCIVQPFKLCFFSDFPDHYAMEVVSMYVSTKSRRLGCSSFFRRLYRARSQGLTTSARSKRWMRVATAEKPDGLFLQHASASEVAAASPAFSRTKIVYTYMLVRYEKSSASCRTL